MESGIYQSAEIFYSTKKVLEKLKVSLSTLRRATALLREELPCEIFDKAVNERGYSLEALTVLQQYFKLRSQNMPIDRAVRFLKIKYTQQQAS